MATNWHNNDGLYIKFGTNEAEVGVGGEYNTLGQYREVEVVIDLADLTQTETVIDRNIIIPKGYVLAKVEVFTDTVAQTGTAIDVGVVRLNTTETEVDYDGILAAFATASMSVAGETTVLTEATNTGGDLIGTVMSADYPMWITASRTDATAFTAGRARIKLFLFRRSATT